MKESVSERVKKVREALNQTQKKFHLKADISSSQLSQIENGADPSDLTLSKISNTFNVNKEWLKTGKGDMFLSGTLQENIERANSLMPGMKESILNPWQDEAYEQIKSENLTLRQQIDKLTTAVLNMSMGKFKALKDAASPIVTEGDALRAKAA